MLITNLLNELNIARHKLEIQVAHHHVSIGSDKYMVLLDDILEKEQNLFNSQSAHHANMFEHLLTASQILDEYNSLSQKKTNFRLLKPKRNAKP